ncbi:MAG: tRNA preQ1(34) S-adenosylmethionine ribosyltransferase-isomerase QueA [Lachnospiraceae bacterium]|nr:tRNA preQ1(34) S-adenosylmethionine ribosyltransferase-isomerase QueA [Lachnospiraceae bacterium]
MDLLKRSSYYYELPEELIAQDPLEKRSDSRLMHVDKKTGAFSHHRFYEVGDFLKKGDCLVINNTRVIPARLLGEKEGTGGAIEILLLKRITDTRWECIVRPGKKLRKGAGVSFGDGRLKGEITEVLPDGNRYVDFEFEGIFEEVLDALGEMPLPPYITHKLSDKERYQTVYAKYEGSAAAPTAGLHFTKELLEDIKMQGVNIAELTLHVGLGTFRPVKEDDLRNHTMHTEHYEITEETAELINKTKRDGGRIISVGTTSTRTLESAADESGIVHAGSDDTDIFIYPGYRFKVTDALITNFHLPESTLIMLVSAFVGRDEIIKAYEEAVRERYRFFSFGDAMIII